jgi:hypothetical protein
MKIIYQLCFFGFASNYDESIGDEIFDNIIFGLNIIYILLNFFHSYKDKSTGEEITDNKK